MNKLLILSLILLSIWRISVQDSSATNAMGKYDKLWKQVENLENENQPKSASEAVDQIYKKAYAANDVQQMIKSFLYKNKLNGRIDEDTQLNIFPDFEQLIKSAKNPTDKALLHSLLAQLYLDYFDNHSWEIKTRTNLSDYVPDDIKEWSENIFKIKALDNLNKSVEDVSDLQKVPVKSYEDIIILGEDSKRIYPTMYDFLMNRAIEQSKRLSSNNFAFMKGLSSKKLQIKDLAALSAQFQKLDFSDNTDLVTLQYYRNFLASLSQRGLNEGVVFTELDKDDYLCGKSETYRTRYSLAFLLALEKDNEQNDYNVEVINALIQKIGTNSWAINGNNVEKEKENLTQIYNWYKLGIGKYPNYKRINILKSGLENLIMPSVTIEGESVYYPDKADKKFKIVYKNLNKATIKILDNKTNAVVETQTLMLSPKTDYMNETQEFTIKLNKIGEYSLIPDFDKKGQSNMENNRLDFAISRLANFVRLAGDKQYEFYIVDRMTGKPVDDATVTFYSTNWENKDYNKITSATTDKKGLAYVDGQHFAKQKNDRRYVYKINKENDNIPGYKELPYSSNAYVYTKTTLGSDIISLFTDRSIYRPGQTIYFKGISTQQKDKTTAILNVGKDYDVNFYDTNNQLLAKKSLKTNDFGSLSGEFIIPQGKIAGSYRIEMGNSSQYITVEEYKRPTFDVKFDKVNNTYTFGDKVTLTGHVESFSGVKLQNATINYTINKSSMGVFWRATGSVETIDNGTVSTKDDGSFTIEFVIPENESRATWFNNFFNFSIDASVTDLNGETQQAISHLTVGNVSMMLSVNLPEKLDKASDQKIQIEATNLDGEKVSASGSYSLYNLLANDSINNEIQTGRFSTSENFDLFSVIQKLPSAKYMLKLKAQDDKGRNVETKNYFIIYSSEDKKPPVETDDWFIAKQTFFDSKRDAELILGVSSKDVTILYDLIKGDKVLSRQQINLSQTNRLFTIPYKEEYEDGIYATFTYEINEKAYVQQVQLVKKVESKALRLKFEVFRDKLRPGQQEEWRISVKNSKDVPVLAELLASMYDSSLDKLNAANQWTFNKIFKREVYPSVFGAVSLGTTNYYDFFSKKEYPVDTFSWNHFNWFGFSFGYVTRYNGIMPVAAYRMKGESARQTIISIAELAVPPEADQTGGINRVTSSDVLVRKAKGGQGENAPQIRSNFNETAFFYPQLRTNEKGETVISFTVPESNTTWNFRALAYDKALNTGELSAIAVSRKELMVTPNIPRFLRQGDKTSISTKISNLSDKAISGNVKLEFFDPLTDQIKNISIDSQIQNFSVAKDGSTSTEWSFTVPADADMLGCRIVAQSTSFSDGEQHVISVLPNRILVTESMTMDINGPQTKEFSMNKLLKNSSKTLSNYRLTLEYANNPAWYAIQALPVLSDFKNNNVVDYFNSYYINVLASSIVKQYPKVSNMIKAWIQQGGNKETLMSKLQKNEELKAVLLEETPWVLDAKNETEQMNNLAILFDVNNAQSKMQLATQKLKELQNSDGGWTWYPGMRSSRSITQYILSGFAQLIRLNAVEYPSEVKELQMQALKYVDNKIKEDYDNLKKLKGLKNKVSVSTQQLEYLFVRSNYRDIPISQPAREAERFYTQAAEKEWTDMTLYEQSLLVQIEQSYNNKVLVEKLMRSLREHSTTNEEMGMFWANNKTSVFMGMSDVSVHTSIMDAFKATNAPTTEMDLMKKWLLKQKQTQLWESSAATIDAIYALLNTGSDWFADSGASQITVGGKLLQPQNEELGTGYVKQSWSGNQISADLAKVEISKPGNGPAWGAMYWQYYEDLDKITADKGVLNVDKKIFIEKPSDKGKVLTQITQSNSLSVGDKAIVRLTVRVDRNMEFVQVKDMRASCFEPIETLSGTKWQRSVTYYQTTKDASTNFYFDYLPKGTYVFEYPVYVNRTGEYSNGITTIQCLYAPEFVSHTEGITVSVK